MSDEPLMPFGKHKGEPINKVPPGYARWLLKQDKPPTGWLGEAMERRAKGKKYIKDDDVHELEERFDEMMRERRKYTPHPPDETFP
jgi:uncharacterized protein (DUF3820 family)